MAGNANPSLAFQNVQYQFDGLSPIEGINFLLKKSLGYPNTAPRGPLTSEIVNNYNSFPFLTISKQYNQEIPETNPNDYILDTSWSNFGYRSFFKPFLSDTISKRYYSSNYPFIAMYSNLLLTSLGPEGAPFPQFNYDTTYPAYTHTLLVNAIPLTFDPTSTYAWSLFTSNGVLIDPVDGFWLCDTDAGVITFYDSNTTVEQVTNHKPPRFTFFRYEGLIGTTNVASTQDL
jgi:hypothetical protein